jgi:hypothetical protein
MRACAAWAALFCLLATSAAADVASGRQAIESGDYDGALSVLQPLAAQGDPEASLLLGEMAEHGWGVPKSDSAAWAFYKRAADRGLAEAAARAAAFAESGRGVATDRRLAYTLYKRAADAGNARARGRIGAMALYGRGRKVDFGQAVVWLQQAAAADDPEALSLLDDLAARQVVKPWPAGSANPAEAPARRVLEEIGRVLSAMADHFTPVSRLVTGAEVTALARPDGSVMVTVPEIASPGAHLSWKSGTVRLIFRDITDSSAKVEILLPSRLVIADTTGAVVGSVTVAGQQLSGTWSFAWHALTDYRLQALNLQVDFHRLGIALEGLNADQRLLGADNGGATVTEDLSASSARVRLGDAARGGRWSVDGLAWHGELHRLDLASYARWAQSTGFDWRSGSLQAQLLLYGGPGGLPGASFEAVEQVSIDGLTGGGDGFPPLALHRLNARLNLTDIEHGAASAHLSYFHQGLLRRPVGFFPCRLTLAASIERLPLEGGLQFLEAAGERLVGSSPDHPTELPKPGSGSAPSFDHPMAALALFGTRIHIDEAELSGHGWDATGTGGVAPTAGGLALAADIRLHGLDALLQERKESLGPGAVQTLRTTAKPGKDGGGQAVSRFDIVLPPDGEMLVNGSPLTLETR